MHLRNLRRIWAICAPASSAAALCVTAALAAQAAAPSWPQWRGVTRDGAATFTAPATWPQQLTRRWRVTVGAGHSSPVIAGDRVIVHTRQAEREVVAAYDLASGKPIWQDAYAAPYTVNPAAQAHGPGPKSTPAVANGRVFTFGISGILAAHDVASGKLLWRTDAAPAAPQYGSAMSPIVDGTAVIAHMGGDTAGALTSFDAATGKIGWRWTGAGLPAPAVREANRETMLAGRVAQRPDVANAGPGYSSPIIATLAGTRQLVTQTQRALVGVDVANGRLLWQVPIRTNFEQNAVTPLVAGDLVIYSGLENPTSALRVVRKGVAFTTEAVWRNEQVSMSMSSPVLVDATIFGLSHRNRGQFFALDLATGKTLWTTRGREGDNASIVGAGGLLLLFTTNAEMIVARATPGAWTEVKRYSIADSAVWAHPAVVGRQIVVKDVDQLILWTL